MDEQKKQKVLIGAVAVVALGAGGYWFVGRDSGGGAEKAIQVSTSGRRERKESANTDKRAERKKRDRKEAPKREAARRERAEVERKTTSRRKRSRSNRKKVKKESMVPAA